MNTDETITIHERCAQAGISMATVSRVVNGNKNVRKHRKKVLEVIDHVWIIVKCGCAWQLVKKTTTVGLSSQILQIAICYFSKGIDDIATMYKYNIVLASSDENDHEVT